MQLVIFSFNKFSKFDIFNLHKTSTVTDGVQTKPHDGRYLHPISSLNIHHKEPVLAIDYNSTSRLGVTAGGSGLISIWKLKEQFKLSKHLDIKTPSKGFNAVRIRPDSKLLILCSWDGVVRLYSPKQGKLLALLDFHRQSVNAISFNNGGEFVTSSKDNTICVWSLYAK